MHLIFQVMLMIYLIYMHKVLQKREREGERENEGEIVKEGRERFCNIQCLLKRSIFNDCRIVKSSH